MFLLMFAMKGVPLMTIISLADCCRLLAIDPKTFRRWLALSQLTAQPHPFDARIKGVTRDQLLLVATAHHRRLPELPADPPVLTPTGKTEELPPLSPETINLLQALTELPAQIAALQQHLAVLAEQMHSQRYPLAATTSHSQAIARVVPEAVLASTEAASPTSEEAAVASSQPACRPTDRRKQRAQVLPVVEYGTHGGYVVICPKQGILSLEPDSPEWFAWLGTLPSFRFLGRDGRLTAHRGYQCSPGISWRAHRQIRNHTYNHRLGQTECVTIAVLEQAAAALQSHLK